MIKQTKRLYPLKINFKNCSELAIQYLQVLTKMLDQKEIDHQLFKQAKQRLNYWFNETIKEHKKIMELNNDKKPK